VRDRLARPSGHCGPVPAGAGAAAGTRGEGRARAPVEELPADALLGRQEGDPADAFLPADSSLHQESSG
jgi:hypothetical protein